MLVAAQRQTASGALTAMIARAADFHGPGASNGVPNVLVFEPFSRDKKASWLVNDSVPHSLIAASFKSAVRVA